MLHDLYSGMDYLVPLSLCLWKGIVSWWLQVHHDHQGQVLVLVVEELDSLPRSLRARTTSE